MKSEAEHSGYGKRLIVSVAWAGFAGYVLIFQAGCLVKRGMDFGSWAQSGERIGIIHLTEFTNSPALTGKEKVVLFPSFGKASVEARKLLSNSLYHEMQNYIPGGIFEVSGDERMNSFLNEDNIVLAGDVLNYAEIGRIGALVGATHAVCVMVKAHRPYPPQVLSLLIVLVDTKTGLPKVEMKALFDASEQQVVMAMAEFLQSRRARKYDAQSLDTMLRSQAEFIAFVSSKSSRALSVSSWGGGRFKR